MRLEIFTQLKILSKISEYSDICVYKKDADTLAEVFVTVIFSKSEKKASYIESAKHRENERIFSNLMDNF